MFYVIQTFPVPDCQTGQIGCSQGRCLNAFRTYNIRLQDIRLELHKEIIGTGAAVHL